LGSTSLTDASGAVVWAGQYEAFGKTQVTTGTTTNNLRFPGQYYDEETGLHYNWNRYYDPGTGRYVTRDPIGLEGGLNTYLYALGNPVNARDPLGLFVLIPPIDGAPPSACDYYDEQCEKSKADCDSDCYACSAGKCCRAFGDNPWNNCTRKCLIKYDKAQCASKSGDSRASCRITAHIICYASCINVIEIIKWPFDIPECIDALNCL